MAKRQPNASRTRHVIGCMSGTSMDGVDVAMVRIRGEGLSMRAQLLDIAQISFTQISPSLTQQLRKAARQQKLSAQTFTQLGAFLAEAHLHAVGMLQKQYVQKADLVVLHGQTLFHDPPMNWQWIDAAKIAHTLHLPVVFDLRAADLACGGRGAPITPLADWVLFRHRTQRRMVLNLGGFINFTYLPADMRGTVDQIEGGDVCACNQLLDAIARKRFREPFDDQGKKAMRGSVHAKALRALMAILRKQASAKRSLGTGDEVGQWVQQFKHLAPADMARTAVQAIAQTVAGVLKQRKFAVDAVMLAGGGARNQALLQALREVLSNVTLSDVHGIPIEAREAAAMAILGTLCQDHIPITLPQVTGVTSPPVAGAWISP